MKKFVKIVSRTWVCMAIVAVAGLILVSPYYVADWGDEISVVVYCLVMAPIVVGAAVASAKPFVSWLRS